MEEKTLIQCADDCDMWLIDAESAISAIGERDCPFSEELENFRDYFSDPFHYILRNRPMYAEDWIDLYEKVCQWLVENK